MNELSILAPSNVLYLGVAALVLVGIAAIIKKLDALFFKSSGPIQFLLDCDEEAANRVWECLQKIGVGWTKFNSDFTLARGYFLPLYGRVTDDQPIAVCSEVQKAFIGACIRGTYKADLTNAEMLDVIARELVNFRNDSSPLTNPVRKIDGIVF